MPAWTVEEITAHHTRNGGRAFPRPASGEESMDHPYPASPGMSLRDYFAGQALSTLIPENWEVKPASYRQQVRNLTHWAYEFADAMIAERDLAGQ